MKVTITYIELRGPFQFFVLSAAAMKIIRQLKTTECKEYRARGIWMKHYTMTLWNNEEEMKAFAYSGAHMDSMKKSKSMAKEIRTITIDAKQLPDWKEAKELLKKGKVLTY